MSDNNTAVAPEVAQPVESSQVEQPNTNEEAVSETITPEEEAELSSESSSEAKQELSKAEAKEAKKLWELKVNGKKLSVDEEELIRRAQKAEAAEETDADEVSPATAPIDVVDDKTRPIELPEKSDNELF